MSWIEIISIISYILCVGSSLALVEINISESPRMTTKPQVYLSIVLVISLVGFVLSNLFLNQ